MDFEDLITCPYNESHQIRPSRIHFHLVKCRKRNPEKEMAICPFNATHHVPRGQEAEHKMNCPDRKYFDLQVHEFYRPMLGNHGDNSVPRTFGSSAIGYVDENGDILDKEVAEFLSKSGKFQRRRFRNRLRTADASSEEDDNPRKSPGFHTRDVIESEFKSPYGRMQSPKRINRNLEPDHLRQMSRFPKTSSVKHDDSKFDGSKLQPSLQTANTLLDDDKHQGSSVYSTRDVKESYYSRMINSSSHHDNEIESFYLNQMSRFPKTSSVKHNDSITDESFQRDFMDMSIASTIAPPSVGENRLPTMWDRPILRQPFTDPVPKEEENEPTIPTRPILRRPKTQN